MEEPTNHKFRPIEITTHNLYFHEDSPILSTDYYDGMTATCGFDNTIRLWDSKFSQMKYRDNVYRTAANSSISFELFRELTGFTRPINCIRFYKNEELLAKLGCRFILAACCDGGKVMIFTDKESYLIRKDTSEDAYELCWCEADLLVGFENGTIEAYKMKMINEEILESNLNQIEQNTGENSNNTKTDENKTNAKSINTLFFNCYIQQKLHSATIQGISFNSKYNLIATHSLDKTVKIHSINSTGFELITIFDNKIDNTRGLFKRLLFENNALYIFIKNNIVNVIAYPFKSVHLQSRIGPLNSSLVKILKSTYKNTELLYLCTKKSVYILNNNKLICTVDNCCYMALTDAIVVNDTIILSSMDGFLTTIRLS